MVPNLLPRVLIIINTLKSVKTRICKQEDIALPILNLLYDYFEITMQHRLLPGNKRSPDLNYLNATFDR